MKNHPIFALFSLFVFALIVGCGGGSGGGGAISQTTGVPIDDTPQIAVASQSLANVLSLSEPDQNEPFGVIKSSYTLRENEVSVKFLNTLNQNVKIFEKTFQVGGEIGEGGEANVEWYFNRPEEIQDFQFDVSGDIGASSMELLFEGINKEVLKRLTVTGQLQANKIQRVWYAGHNLVTNTAGVWRIVFSVKGKSDKSIVLSISRHQKDLFDFSIEPQNLFKEIYSNLNFIEKTKGLGLANKYSVANSIILTLQRFACKVSEDNIEKILSYVIDARQSGSGLHILDKETNVIVLNGTAPNDPRQVYDYCLELGLSSASIQFFNGPTETNPKVKFLSALVNSPNKTTVLIGTHGNPDRFVIYNLDSSKPITMDDVDKSNVYPEDIAKALLERAKVNNGKLDDVCICLDACFSGDFMQNMLKSLATGVSDIKSFPVLVSSANRDQYSYGTTLYPLLRKEMSVLTVSDMMKAEEDSFCVNDTAFFIPQDQQKFSELKSSLSFLGKEGSGLPGDLPVFDLNIKGKVQTFPYIQLNSR